MAFDFNSIMEKAKDLAQTGVAKAKELTDSAVDKGKELSEIGKLKVQNASEQEAVKKAYLEIGKLYFAERGAAPEAPYAALCQQITEAQEKIAYNNQRIEDIKAAGKADDEEIGDFECECGCECAPEESCCCGEAPAEEAPAEEPCCCGCQQPEEPQAPEQDCCTWDDKQ